MVTRIAHESMSTFFTVTPKDAAGQSLPALSSEQMAQYALITRASRGDQEAFAAIVEQYSTSMLHTASLIAGDHDIAEDIVQDALIQAWHHLPDLRNSGALRSWLMRIVVNQCISFKRRVNRSATSIPHVYDEHESSLVDQAAHEHKESLERNWDLAQAINTLPLKQRIVIVLHYYHGMTVQEMAQLLATSENTLKKRIQAALVNLRHFLHSNEKGKPPRSKQRATIHTAA